MTRIKPACITAPKINIRWLQFFVCTNLTICTKYFSYIRNFIILLVVDLILYITLFLELFLNHLLGKKFYRGTGFYITP
jgi:hypothetical protein